MSIPYFSGAFSQCFGGASHHKRSLLLENQVNQQLSAVTEGPQEFSFFMK